MKKRFTLLFLAGTLFGNSCSTDLGYVPSRTELLSKTWVLMQVSAVSGTVASVYTKGAKSNITDLSKVQLNINADGTYAATAADGNKHTGTWEFADNRTRVIFSDASDNTVISYRLAEIIDKHLTLKKVISPTTSDATEAGYVQVAKALKLNPEKNGLEISWSFMNK